MAGKPRHQRQGLCFDAVGINAPALLHQQEQG
jgi:hypothetical protein